MAVIATAGHVDHGKSTLVRALTGTDPDRWAEERARGLTIDLGFAATRLPSGTLVEFVDVPGHTRYLRNMLAGAGAVSACLFVVSAVEGWRAQSEEHLRILDLLGAVDGVVALTHALAADDVEERVAAVAERLAGTFLEGAAIVPVDAPAGHGLERLTAELDALHRRLPAPPDRNRPRLFIDRSFVIHGSGTVVTGTLGHGSLSVEDQVTVVPHGGIHRIRALHHHGEAVARIGPGHRVAVNLAGVDHSVLRRGDALVRPDRWWTSTVMDVALTVAAGHDVEVRARGAWRLHLGSGEWTARLRVLGGGTLPPGSTGGVRLRLDAPVPVVPGDRFILRDLGRDVTVGGGRILDVDPVLPAARARPDDDPSRVLRERGALTADRFALLTGREAGPDVGPWILDPHWRRDREERLLEQVGDTPDGLPTARLDALERALVTALVGEGRLEAHGATVHLPGTRPMVEHPFLQALRATPFTPPPADGVDPAVTARLIREGAAIRLGGILYAAEAVDGAARILGALLRRTPEGVTVSEARAALATSRRFALPLLARLDEIGVTRRRGDVRVGGPRLPPG